MQTKKIIGIASFITALAYANFASAYDLLVEIPGIPHTNVSMSMYLVGIYDFLLSIVGIVAVMMLIVGGMRYITAAGNQAAAGDAKDIINNAIAGLLLALLSWVFVSTINPDVLYIKAPADISLATWNPSCTRSAVDTDPCICNDGSSIANPAATSCDDVCAINCEFPVSESCIEAGYDNLPADSICHCYDGTEKDLGQPTIVTMTVSDNQPSVGDNVLVSGKITSLGAGLVPPVNSLRLIRVNSGVGSNSDDVAGSINVLFPGDFQILIPIGCKAIEEWQVVYDGFGSTSRTASPRIIVGSTIGPGIACVAGLPDYADASTVSIWKEPYNDCNSVCINNCGWRYLRVKLHPEGAYDDDDDTYSLNSDAELWDFYLTDDGEVDNFNIQSFVQDFTVGADTYHCAILETREILGPDKHGIHWVKKGVTIKSDGGNSFKKDIEESAKNSVPAINNPSVWCCKGGDPACDLSLLSVCDSNSPTATDNEGIIWYSAYTGDLISKCGDCSMAQLNNAFRPSRSITCVEDPANSAQGLWRYTD